MASVNASGDSPRVGGLHRGDAHGDAIARHARHLADAAVSGARRRARPPRRRRAAGRARAWPRRRCSVTTSPTAAGRSIAKRGRCALTPASGRRGRPSPRRATRRRRRGRRRARRPRTASASVARMPAPIAAPPAPRRPAIIGANSTSCAAKRLASTTSNGPRAAAMSVPMCRSWTSFAAAFSAATAQASAIDVDRPDLAGAELARGDGEDARAGAEVEHARAGAAAPPRAARGTRACWRDGRCRTPCRDRARSPTRPRGTSVDPRRVHEQPLADRQRRKVRLPVLRPTGVGDRRGLDVGSRQVRVQLGQPVETALQRRERWRLGEMRGDARHRRRAPPSRDPARRSRAGSSRSPRPTAARR